MLTLDSIKLDVSLDERSIKRLNTVFNTKFKTAYPSILSWTHVDYYRMTNEGSPSEWKEFLKIPQVSTFIDEERKIFQETAYHKLILGAVEDDKMASTAKVQAISQFHTIQKANEQKKNEEQIFIYSFVPLTKDEMGAPNVKILDFIPKEIDNAIKRYE